MDGLHRVAGLEHHLLQVGDKTYTLRSWTIADHAALEREIVSRRGDPFLAAAVLPSHLPADFRTSVADGAKEARKRLKWATKDDVAEFSDSTAGVAWRLWVSLRRDHPEITGPAAALDVIAAMGASRLPELFALLALAQQEIDLQSVVWPESAGSPQPRTPWAAIYAQLAERYQWPPEVVGRLTLYQCAIYCGAFVPEHGIVSGKAMRGGR